MLIENNTVEAVLSLPGGVFQPYSGVKTSVLCSRKGGRTERVLFLHADADGYKLDANHDTPIEADDLPALVEAYQAYRALVGMAAARRRGRGPRSGGSRQRTSCAAADFNLSASRGARKPGADRAPRPAGIARRTLRQ